MAHRIVSLAILLLMVHLYQGCMNDTVDDFFGCNSPSVNENNLKKVFFPDSVLNISVPAKWAQAKLEGDTTTSILVIDTTLLRTQSRVSSITLSQVHPKISNLKTYFQNEVDLIKKKYKLEGKGQSTFGKHKSYWISFLDEDDLFNVLFCLKVESAYLLNLRVTSDSGYEQEICDLFKYAKTLEKVD